VFVNGALAVPGAPASTDTVPAKFSEKNAADDKLITLAYTFKLLTDEQRRAIYEGLKGQEAGPAFNVGVELPSSTELRPVPNDVAARVPQTKDYRYAVADNRVLLVSPVGRLVVGVFMDDVQPMPRSARHSNDRKSLRVYHAQSSRAIRPTPLQSLTGITRSSSCRLASRTARHANANACARSY
jgi:Protein of unknown function (DUF1236)